MKLKCPNCDAEGTLGVVETRQSAKIIYRTRKCDSCKWRFITEEKIAENESIPTNIRYSYRQTEKADVESSLR